MFNVTDTAIAEIAAYFADKKLETLRIFSHTAGCSLGSQLLMTEDEKKDGDEVFNINGIEFVIEKTLLEEAAPVKVDFLDTGFTITSSLKTGGDDCCSSCSGGCSPGHSC
ncbi:MAG: adhesin [Deltaproteobacteria bacterium]|nr:MAG: adhesin [Deltaproteobacteria bacterium]